jgi:predicted Zn finger-like uncharacterized protein
MKIVCPTCTTSYDVGASALGESGRSVRCVRCRTVWFATPGEEPEVVAELALEAAADGETGSAENPQGGEDEAASAGEFDWSFSVDEPQEQREAAGETAGEEGAAQAEVDTGWAVAAAEPVETAAPSLVPAMEADAIPEPAGPPGPAVMPESIESVAARRAPKARKPKSRSLKCFAPQTASLYGAVGLPVNLRGLVFENVRTTGELHEGVPVLIVEGTIANVVNKTVEVPRLRFAMRNAAGHEIYAWTSVTGRSILSPGETATFRSRLASPPTDGRDVIVRFLNRRDLVAGMR